LRVNNVNHSYRYDIQSLCLIFFPRESFKEGDTSDKELTVILGEKTAKATFICKDKEITEEVSLTDFPIDRERAAVKKAAYLALCKVTGITSPWGSLTGIRPALFYQKVMEEFGAEADNVMKSLFSISDQKLSLCGEVLEGRKIAIEKNTPDAASLYVSIPFCPSRCSYCSFVSAITGREAYLIPNYIEKLVNEAKTASEAALKDGKVIKSIYVGGGTPSVLEPKEMKKLLDTIQEQFLKKFPVEEFTFEAGRPDTITKEKLELLHDGGVTRISINPQTLSQRVLDAVGRKHTVKQFFDAYEWASKYSFDKNVDLIAGLPLDT
jgi:oxygen-independent coproporphyrinogen-3 oxidase